jgi:hypothetical protein
VLFDVNFNASRVQQFVNFLAEGNYIDTYTNSLTVRSNHSVATRVLLTLALLHW